MVDDALDYPAGRRGVNRLSQRVPGTLILWTLVTVSGLSLIPGCARGPRLTVPSVLTWRQKPDEFAALESEPPSEPTVSANVARAPAFPADETLPDNPAGAARVTSEWPARESQPPADSADPFAQFGVTQTSAVAKSPASVAGLAHSTSGDSLKTSPPATELPQAKESAGQANLVEFAEAATVEIESSKRLQQLRQALSADVERVTSEQNSVAQQPLRLRADALMARALELQGLGYLHEARRAAQQAVELAKSGNIEYLPTDVRPDDVLQQVETDLVVATGTSDSRRLATNTAAVVTPDAEVQKFQAEPDLIHDRGGVAVVSANAQAGTGTDSQLVNRPPVSVRPRDAAGTVTANRPVTIRGSFAAGSASSEGPILPAPEGDLGQSPALKPLSNRGLPVVALNAPSLPLPELPPFRGEDAQVNTSATEAAQPLVAPAPPIVEELEPLPSVRGNSQGAFVTEFSPQPQIRPLFSTGSLISALAMLGGILLVVGCGLMFRRLREAK